MDIKQKVLDSASKVEVLIQITNEGLGIAYTENPTRYPRKLNVGSNAQLQKIQVNTTCMDLNEFDSSPYPDWDDWNDQNFDNFDNSEPIGDPE